MKYEFFNSPIHNIGCRATVDIKMNETVAIETFFIFNTKISKNYFKEYVWKGSPFGINGNLLINGLGSWCNHSDNQNLKLIMDDKEKKFVKFIALKDIKKGEELFNNYGVNWWKNRNQNNVLFNNNKKFKVRYHPQYHKLFK
tara:strand:- start:718 stop:1143 length:426 start_codon:yes stop_codon:yes gene_type:complete